MKKKKLDPNDPEVIRLLKLTKKQQEKNNKLKKIDPKIGDLFVGGMLSSDI